MRTRVGYCGGAKQSPTYHDLGDHTETFQVDYDPKKISYDKLLEVFWKEHVPTDAPWSVQYKAVVFAATDEQERLATASRDALEKKLGKKVTTEIRRKWTFWLAEDYHQKYLLQNRPEIARELRKIYPRTKDLVDSTAAARINGWLAGHGDPLVFEKEVGDCGLSKEARALLRKRMGQAESKSCGE